MIQPRYYQQEAHDSLIDYFQNNKGNPILALPTGTGKSIIIAMFVKTVLSYPKQKIFMLTHRKTLIQQNFQKLLQYFPLAPAGIYSAGLKRKETYNQITYAGIASIYKKAEQFGPYNLAMIDECHLVSSKNNTMYVKFYNDMKKLNPNFKVIGLTATPYRLSLGALTEGGMFTDIAYDLTSLDSFNKLVAEGYIAPLVSKCTEAELDVSGVHIRNSEYIQHELQQAVDKEEITRQAIEEVLRTIERDPIPRNHWLFYASGIEHAEHISQMLNDQFMIPTGVVHSKISDVENDITLQKFKHGILKALVNVDILTTGYDFPGLDLGVILRPTLSAVLWVQMLGRFTRPFKGKVNALILDFAGNTRRLGPINDPILPTKKKKGKKQGTAPVKVCNNCFIYNHISVRICIECGQEFPKNIKIKNKAYTEDVMTDGKPIIKWLTIDNITYSDHNKPGKLPSLKVTYYCFGSKPIKEFICFEHSNFPRRKATQWWRKRTALPIPNKVLDSLRLINYISTPTRIKVWVNKKYPEVLDYDFNKGVISA